MKNFFWFWILALLPLSVLADSAQTEQAHSKARLVFEEKGIVPGRTEGAGIHITLEEGWHTYWINPGDSGMAPKFHWTLPEGFSTEGPLMPVPKRFEAAQISGFGYEKEVLFIFELANQLSPNASGNQKIALDAEWLVCRETCIPAKFHFEMDVPVVSAGDPSPEATLFARYRAFLPQTDTGLDFHTGQTDKTAFLDIPSQNGSELLDFLPYSALKIKQAKPKIEKQPSGGFRVSFEKQDFTSFPDALGVLVFAFPGTGNVQAIEVVHQSSTGSFPGFWQAFLFAFVGGFLLNLMPCVFPCSP